jgi:hypothetical protein
MMVTVKPIMRSLIPAMQLLGITKPYPNDHRGHDESDEWIMNNCQLSIA